MLLDRSDYRYKLTRGPWLNGEGTVLFVMLNPCTADEREDDPTIRRCIGFAQSWGFARLLVGNLYGLRATNPRELFQADDPVGPGNNAALTEMVRNSPSVIVAWGATPHPLPHRARQVLEMLEFYAGTARCLGQTKDLHPRHPLYVKRDAKRIVFKRYAEMAA